MIPLACDNDEMIVILRYVEGKRPLVEGWNFNNGLRLASFDCACDMMPKAAVECVFHFFGLVWFGVLWREKFCGGIIGNDHAPRNAREWKGRE